MINNMEEIPQPKTPEENKISRLQSELAEKEELIHKQREELTELHEFVRTQDYTAKIKIQALEQTIHLLREEVTFDGLTGLYTRKAFDQKLQEELSKMNLSKSVDHKEQRKEDVLKHLSLILIDADHFKQINDTKGHIAGDQVLQKVATILKSGLRESDPVCRYGGEEMIIMLPGAEENKAFEIAEKLRIEIEQTQLCTVSMGIASYEDGIVDSETFINRADQAMYKAKHKPNGRNCVERYSNFTL